MSNDAMSASEIRDFYENSNILITGGTGFLGRILISKLLTSCESLNRIYLVIRVKKGQSPLSRFKELLDDPVFSTAKTKIPNVESKITCVAGDVSLPNLGLDAEDRELLEREVTHVFHAAATVRFDEKLKTALLVNVRAVNEMIELCSRFKRIKCLMHVSTAYSHCVRDIVEEIFYEAPLDVDNAITLAQNLTLERLESMKDEIIAPWPNTYSFSKAIAEQIVKEKGKGLPAGIFRPSIVVGASEEPIPGWINNVYGPVGICVAVGAGLLRVLKVDTEMKADIVPVDMAVNALICAAWDTHKSYDGGKNDVAESNERCPPVYNFATSDKNPLTWNDYLNYSYRYGFEMPTVKTIWYYTLTTTKTRTVYEILKIFYHILPGIIMDAALAALGKSRLIMKAYRKIHTLSNVIEYFSCRQWTFEQRNTQRLWNAMSEADRTRFNFDMSSLRWDAYMENSISGIRKFIFDDDPSTIPYAKKKLRFFHCCHRLVQTAVAALALWLCLSLKNSIAN